MKPEEKRKIKDYLRSYERAEEKIRQIEEDIDYINQSIDSRSQLFDGMPHTSGMSDRVARDGQRLCSLSMELIAQRDEAAAARKEVAGVIRRIEDVRYMRLLYARYIELKSWAEIALNMDRDPRWVFRMHNYALEEVKKILTI